MEAGRQIVRENAGMGEGMGEGGRERGRDG